MIETQANGAGNGASRYGGVLPPEHDTKHHPPAPESSTERLYAGPILATNENGTPCLTAAAREKLEQLFGKPALPNDKLANCFAAGDEGAEAAEQMAIGAYETHPLIATKRAICAGGKAGVQGQIEEHEEQVAAFKKDRAEQTLAEAIATGGSKLRTGLCVLGVLGLVVPFVALVSGDFNNGDFLARESGLFPEDASSFQTVSLVAAYLIAPPILLKMGSGMLPRSWREHFNTGLAFLGLLLAILGPFVAGSTLGGFEAEANPYDGASDAGSGSTSTMVTIGFVLGGIAIYGLWMAGQTLVRQAFDWQRRVTEAWMLGTEKLKPLLAQLSRWQELDGVLDAFVRQLDFGRDGFKAEVRSDFLAGRLEFTKQVAAEAETTRLLKEKAKHEAAAAANEIMLRTLTDTPEVN